MIQIAKMIRDAGGAYWDVPPMAVSVNDIRRGSSFVAVASYAGREVEARGKTLEASQHALVSKIQRRIAKRIIRQMRTLSAHAGQPLPHRFDGLPLPYSSMQFELLWSKIRKYHSKAKAAAQSEQTAVAA